MQKRIAQIALGVVIGLVAAVVAFVVVYHNQSAMTFAEMASSFIVTYLGVVFLIVVIVGIARNLKMSHFLGNTSTPSKHSVSDPA